jgi:hypothetical protein
MPPVCRSQKREVVLHMAPPGTRDMEATTSTSSNSSKQEGALPVIQKAAELGRGAAPGGARRSPPWDFTPGEGAVAGSR